MQSSGYTGLNRAHLCKGSTKQRVSTAIIARLFIASPSGRKRFNVLAPVDAVTKTVLAVTNETYINSESVCLLLSQIAAAYANLPITHVLDNARYQKCELVFHHAASLGIELL